MIMLVRKNIRAACVKARTVVQQKNCSKLAEEFGKSLGISGWRDVGCRLVHLAVCDETVMLLLVAWASPLVLLISPFLEVIMFSIFLSLLYAGMMPSLQTMK